MSVDLRPAERPSAARFGGITGGPRADRHDAATWGATIGGLCSLFGLTPRAIRFYEERGLVTASRDARNRRIFDRRARRRLQFIADLRHAALPLNDIRELLDGAGDDEVRLRRHVLAKLAERLETLDASRREIVRTIEHFSRDPASGKAGSSLQR